MSIMEVYLWFILLAVWSLLRQQHSARLEDKEKCDELRSLLDLAELIQSAS